MTEADSAVLHVLHNRLRTCEDVLLNVRRVPHDGFSALV